MSGKLELKDKDITFEDFFETLNKSDEKFELYQGQIVSMSGGTVSHSRVSFLLQRTLDEVLKKKPCRVFNSDMALRIQNATKETIYFPDAMVKCGAMDSTKRYVENPIIVAEVLSPSTLGTDRVRKFNDYLKIKDLKAYLIVQPDRPEIECWKLENGEPTVWIFGEGEMVEIDTEIRFSLNAIYDDV